MKPTKEQVSALLNEAYSTHNNDVSLGIELAAKALSRSKQLKDKALIAQSLNQLSLFYITIGDFEQAAAHTQEATSYLQEIEEDRKVAEAIKEQAEKAKDLSQLQGKKALLAEDNQLNAKAIITLLKKHGIKTDHVTDGKKAFHETRIKKYDFILMDIHMPEMNGIEAAKAIRGQHNLNMQVPIFAITADIMINNDSDYLPLFNEFLYKPLDIEKLNAALLRAHQSAANCT
jgi:CheY-like chemotaxis protein